MPTNMSTPVPPPGNNSYNPWHDYDVNSVDDMGVNAPAMEEVDTMDLTRVASNVGGMVKEEDPTKWATDIPELTDPLEEETNQFVTAYEEGHTKETKGDIWSGGWSEQGNQKEANTMGAARQAKRDDRKQDREARQTMRKEMWEDLEQQYLDQNMSKGKARRKARRESRKAKRAMRQGQHAQRKDAWETFKGEADLMKQEDAYANELQYS